MYDDSTPGLESPDREDAPLFLRTDCPECGRALADHGLSTAGPGRTRLAPCGYGVAGVTLREVVFVLDDGARRIAADGGSERPPCEICGDEVDDPHITNDGHPEGPNLWACTGCASEEPGVNPDSVDDATGGESA
jgi:hypothetical protein